MNKIHTSQQSTATIVFMVLSAICLYSLIFTLRVAVPIPLFLILTPLLLFFIPRKFTELAPDKVVTILLASYAIPFFVSVLYAIYSHEFYMGLFWGFRIATIVFLFILILGARKFYSAQKNIRNLLYWIFTVHALLAWVGFYLPEIRTFLLGAQYNNQITLNVINGDGINSRLASFGTIFFGAGALYSVCEAMILKQISETKKNWHLWLFLIFISLTGVCLSRTAFLGLIVGGVFLLNKNFKVNLLKAVCAAILTVGVAFTLSQDTNTKRMISWAFEPINYVFNKAAPQMSSTNETITTGVTAAKNVSEEYQKSPLAILAGAGVMFNPDKMTYYGNTDVGYIRLLLYGGIPYVLLFFLPLVAGIYVVHKFNFQTSTKIAVWTIAVIQLICNIKGMIDLSSTILLFYIFTDDNYIGKKLTFFQKK